jgi:acyl CoA:acetate/3-ketoacid CoA transferase alpha subunit
MTAKEWIEQHNIDLSAIHGNIGDYEGNIMIEKRDGNGWEFWAADGHFETVTV